MHHYCPVRVTDDDPADSAFAGHGLTTNKAHSDHFRMYTYKVRRCTRMKKHDWTLCPYSHYGEKAARRDPRRVPYVGVPCPDSSGEGTGCPRGDRCAFAHGVFEYWLHPSRYRTRPCNAGPYCKRRVCFFAHGPEELRPEPNFQFRHSPPFQEDRVAFAPVVRVGPVAAGGSPSLEATLLESFRRMGLVRGSDQQLSCVGPGGQNDVVWWDMLDQELGNLGWSASEAPG